MSLKPLPIGPVPQETARLAKAVFPEGSPFIKMRDELGTLYQDEMFAALFPKEGQPVLAPWRLALVTIMQFAEKLSDRQAAHAVRARLDWKYALGLELDDRGFDFSVLVSVSLTTHRRPDGVRAVRDHAQLSQATWAPQSWGAAAHGCDPCVGGRACDQPGRVCGRNDACST